MEKHISQSSSPSTRPTAVVEVSVIIVNYNGQAFLQRCLDSLSRQTFIDFEALVVDNGSQDGSLEAVVAPDARFRLIPAGKNLGFAAANNLGASLARGRWLATLNPDAFPEPGWLEALLEAAARHPRAALLGSTQILDQDPRLLDGSGDAYAWFGLAWRGNHRHPLTDLPPEGEVFSPCAAAALYRADVFRDLGGFDESFFCYCEDVDLGFRFRLAGHLCIQVPRAVVHHVSGGISGQESPWASYMGNRNSLWTHIKDMPAALNWFSLPAHVILDAGRLLRDLALARLGRPDERARWREMGAARARALRHGLLHSGPAWKARKAVQTRRRAGIREVACALCWSLARCLQRAHDVRPLRSRQKGRARWTATRTRRRLKAIASLLRKDAGLLLRGQGSELARNLGFTLLAPWYLLAKDGAAYFAPPRPAEPLPGDQAGADREAARTATGLSRPIRALMAGFNLNWEGASNSQLELTLALKERGVVDPVVFSPREGPLREAYERAGIRVLVEEVFPARLTREAYLLALKRLETIARREGAELVYANTLQTYFAVDLARNMGLPCLWNPRESEDWRTYFDFLPASLARRALGLFAYPYRVIFVAQSTRQAWSALELRQNFTVIHNGLDLGRLRARAQGRTREQSRSELGLAAGEVAVLLLGTVCERKGQHDLPRALALLPPETWSLLRVFIVGDRPGPYSAQLHRLVKRLPANLRERVIVEPETPDTARYFQAADLFLCASRVESYPRVTMEAMAHGLPILTTPVFGLAEQVREGVNGLFYEPGDAPALARGLTRLVRDPGLRARLSEGAKRVLGDLTSFEDMVLSYSRIFGEAYSSR